MLVLLVELALYGGRLYLVAAPQQVRLSLC
jgi:hypothetical protein